MADKPPQPKYVLRGHTAAIHALHFFAANTLLASGDSDGWVVVWNLSSKRPVAVWSAHPGVDGGVAAGAGVMQIRDWTGERLVTHGRDHALRVWQLRADDYARLSTTLPSDRDGSGGKSGKENNGEAAHTAAVAQPWLLHSLAVNALNFCAFAMCPQRPGDGDESLETTSATQRTHGEDVPAPAPAYASASVSGAAPAQLIAAANGLDQGGIDIFQLPSEHRVSQIKSDPNVNTGMVMAVQLFHDADSAAIGSTSRLLLVSGYEDGQVLVHMHMHVHEEGDPNPTAPGTVGTSGSGGGGGGGVDFGVGGHWVCISRSKPHSQPVLSIGVFPSRQHFVTSSADAIIAKFAIVIPSATRSAPGTVATTSPEKSIGTRHAGQQGLAVRSDGKIFATAGWDARVRVYACKSVKELAVLKWHGNGCFVTAFADVEADDDDKRRRGERGGRMMADQMGVQATTRDVAWRGSALDVIKHDRQERARLTHWLAAGGKDAKISLWDIY